jgi:DNA-binding transcriptional MerR regulator
VRTLHLYNKFGIFLPEFTDEKTGYRYYKFEQIADLKFILSFRKVGFSINEIKKVLSGEFTNEVVIKVLNEKLINNQKQIDKINYKNENIKNMMKSINKYSDEKKALMLSKIFCLEMKKLKVF